MKVFWFGILGVVFFIGASILGGLQFSDYSHLSQFISESYAIGTPYGVQLRYFGFMPSGIFITLFAFLAIKVVPKSTMSQIGLSGIGFFYGLATVLVSLFPCDKGCDNELGSPSLSQIIHNLSGLLTYLIVPICVVVLGIAARKWENGKYVSLFGIFCGITSMLFVWLLSSDLQSEFLGLYQRIVEGSILFWIVVCSFYIRNIRKP